jgi:hypothetical protein
VCYQICRYEDFYFCGGDYDDDDDDTVVLVIVLSVVGGLIVVGIISGVCVCYWCRLYCFAKYDPNNRFLAGSDPASEASLSAAPVGYPTAGPYTAFAAYQPLTGRPDPRANPPDAWKGNGGGGTYA